eukprot:CAMPEP_0170497062 /NCGR_PEP_ID=MMETSP0208-20121228/23595_1 /TAXON_ID=197538 /ORGANISM="Strombidium inclinatum, Strain S3" /LENGTH=47 /DNA_ID= /DNA_START= /DNA_END= /DNA_ORIENTATION=
MTVACQMEEVETYEPPSTGDLFQVSDDFESIIISWAQPNYMVSSYEV